MTRDEIELLLFDPEHLGMPGNATVSGRATSEEMYCEIFLTLQDRIIVDLGFLTNVPGPGLVCASLWCTRVRSRHIEEAAAITVGDIIGMFPPDMHCPELASIAGLCVRAGALALLNISEPIGCEAAHAAEAAGVYAAEDRGAAAGDRDGPVLGKASPGREMS